MPDPKDYMDDNHEYVRGYVRRKQANATAYKRRFWFWRLAWNGRLLILIGAFVGFIALLTISFTQNTYILFGVIAAVVFLYLFLRLVSK